MDWLILILLVGGLRVALRVYWRGLPPRRAGTRPVLVIGAGDAGERVVRELLHNPRLHYHAVGFLDDDPAKAGLCIHGVPVLGTVEDVRQIASEVGVGEAIIAVPSADRRSMRQIVDLCRQAGLSMKTVPGLGLLLAGTAQVLELREVRVEDLLRREPARLDVSLIRNSLRGRRVLVTGAGGSIGSEICRQVAVCEPAVLVLLDRSENALFEIYMELGESFPRLSKAAAMGDIKHIQKLQEVFARFRPEVVFHAAAYKHVPLMEENPEEAVLNNVVGTRRLAEVAIAHRTGVFVVISTDKAVNPGNVMGASKRAVERYVQSLAADPSHGETKLCAVRFGNVLGSSGSVVPIFRRQIEQGGPITITHPEMTRFFMTIPEAVQLVLRAATLAKGGEIFVLDMGEPVKISDMARDMVRLSGLAPERDIQFTVTGLRPGEKLSEELWHSTEAVTPTVQEKLLVIRGPESDGFLELLPQLSELEQLAIGGEKLRLIQTLCRVVPEYQPSSPGLLAKPRVLVAEDDPRMQELIRDILHETHDVIPAGDGAEAISEVRDKLPDLVLLDLKMPGVDGYSVCQALKADPRTRRTPIIMLTALGDAADKVRGIRMGADDYITKPFDGEELKARVQMVLRRAYAT
jgi:FlaA1/EpsC-like NDP-sugar epimerase